MSSYLNTITTEKLPDIIVLSTADIVSRYREVLDTNWLFVVDLESILSIIVSCYNHTPSSQYSLNAFMVEAERDFFELKSGNTKLQKEFVLTILRSLINDIDRYMNESGLIDYEYFPYKLQRLMFDGSIVLRKTQP